MARTDKTTYEEYAKDVFDNPPQGPLGVHRGPRSLAARLTPYVAVVLVAALCGVAAWGLFSGEAAKIRFPWQSSSSVQASDGQSDSDAKNDADADADAGTSANTDDDASADGGTDGADASADGSTDAEQQTQTTVEPQSAVNKGTSVRVVNAAGINGYAAQKAAILQSAGYTSVEAANPTGSVPSYTVVWYQNETDKATADDVAAALGISAVERVDGISAPITVVLLN